MNGFAHPEVLIDTDWVDAHREDADVRLVEVDVYGYAYESAHIPGALAWSWTTDLSDAVRRDILSKPQFEDLMERSGIANDTTVILYGDHNNWFAAWAFWQMKYYGHDDVRLMDGGRQKWLGEGREVTTEVPEVARAKYEVASVNRKLRALLPEIRLGMEAGDTGLVDVRTPQEYTGEVLAPEGMTETCQRGGHIPGAVNIPWASAVNEDGTFRSPDELENLYRSRGITRDAPVITYCRIGERSSHSWFVLKYLLGYPDVRNYDGSWTEWGNLVGMPVARGNRPEGV